ncbi:hypothetical protein Tco_1084399 [Tanacetum coccineum]
MMCQQPRVKRMRRREPHLLMEVAGGNVITIASTNRPDILDPALKPKSEDVDYAAVAAMTDRMVGAELIGQSLLDHITLQLAPRAADEIWHGEGQLSTIWAETLITIVLLFIYASSLCSTLLCMAGPLMSQGVDFQPKR